MKAAILFADISDSTRLYETLGDTEALRVTLACMNRLGSLVEHYQGELIRTIGDEVMCTFPTALQAATAAIDMQTTISGGDTGLSIRVGFHYGDIIHQSNDIYGDAVNLAARLAAQAKARQILTSQTVIDQIRSQLPPTIPIRLIDQAVRLKGKQTPITIFELIWGNLEDLTLTALPLNIFEPGIQPSNRLILEHRDQNTSLSVETCPFTIGRADHNHLVVEDALASRLHAQILYRHTRFILVDQSSNGTFIQPENETAVFLHRDERVLTGQGLFALGRAVSPDNYLNIRYKTNS